MFFWDRSAQTSCLGYKQQTKLAIWPSHSTLTVGQPVPILILQDQVPSWVATRVPISKLPVWPRRVEGVCLPLTAESGRCMSPTDCGEWKVYVSYWLQRVEGVCLPLTMESGRCMSPTDCGEWKVYVSHRLRRVEDVCLLLTAESGRCMSPTDCGEWKVYVSHTQGRNHIARPPRQSSDCNVYDCRFEPR